MKFARLQGTKIDYLLGFILLVLPIPPLLLIRVPTAHRNALLVGVLSIPWLCICWAFISRNSYVNKPTQLDARTSNNRRILTGVAICILFLILAIITFYIPSRRYFWTGGDEAVIPQTATVWSTPFDGTYNRPLALIGMFISQLFSPDTFDGYFWLNLMIWTSSALLIYGIVRVTLRVDVLALGAALLFLANPSEPTRFYAIWLDTYILASFLLLLALWLYMQSYLQNARWMLVLSCFVLSICLLSNEGGLILALVSPLIIFTFKSRMSMTQTKLWLGAWFGTTLIFIARFVLFFKSAYYQQSFITPRSGLFADIPGRIITQLLPTLRFISIPSDVANYVSYSLLVAVLACIAVWLMARHLDLSSLRSSILVGIGLCVIFIVAGIVPFLPLTPTYGTFRTQYYALGGQAVIWILIATLIGTFMPKRLQRFWITIAIGLLIVFGLSTTLSINENSYNYMGYTLYPKIQFSNVVRAFTQVHTVAPNIMPDTLVIFILDDPTSSPIAMNYAMSNLGMEVLGVKAFQINFLDPGNCRGQFTNTGVNFCDFSQGKESSVSYSQIIAFQLADDGSVKLLEQLPDMLVSSFPASNRYNPHARIEPGEVVPLRFLR